MSITKSKKNRKLLPILNDIILLKDSGMRVGLEYQADIPSYNPGKDLNSVADAMKIISA